MGRMAGTGQGGRSSLSGRHCAVVQSISPSVRGSAKRWDLGCVNSPPTARGSQEAGFTQPRVHLLADPCTMYIIVHCETLTQIYPIYPTGDEAGGEPDESDSTGSIGCGHEG